MSPDLRPEVPVNNRNMGRKFFMGGVITLGLSAIGCKPYYYTYAEHQKRLWTSQLQFLKPADNTPPNPESGRYYLSINPTYFPFNQTSKILIR